jgi:hypothetical protein
MLPTYKCAHVLCCFVLLPTASVHPTVLCMCSIVRI